MRVLLPFLVPIAALASFACSSDTAPAPSSGTGGLPASGGVTGATGGVLANGGAPASGGMLATGGLSASGGAGAGGTATGGSGSGGASSGGATHVDGGFAVRAIASPPSYKGTVNNAGGCARDYPTRGFEPDDVAGTKHPLFLYFIGTNFFSDEAAFREQARPAAEAVTKAMARRGMVALWVEYDNSAISWLSDHVAQLGCLFGKSNSHNILSLACSLPQVDCDLGIATWGHSQGAYVANRARNDDERVRAVWLSGYGGEDPAVVTPKERLRIVNGENDPNGKVDIVNRISGLTAAECPDDGRSECLRADGSGWIIVRAKDCVTSSADHCWFDKKTCTGEVALEPNWVDPASTKPFALEPNADWIAATLARP